MARTIETKLRRDVLYSSCRIERIRRHWLYRLGWVNAYSTEIVAAASAAGLASPFFAASQAASQGANVATLTAAPATNGAASTPGSDQQLLEVILSTPLGWVGVGLFALAIVLRVINVIHAMTDKHVISRTALHKISDLSAQVRDAMNDEDCVTKLNDLVSTSVRPAFDMARQGQCLPRFTQKDEDEMAKEIDAFVQSLRAEYSDKLALEIEGQR